MKSFGIRVITQQILLKERGLSHAAKKRGAVILFCVLCRIKAIFFSVFHEIVRLKIENTKRTLGSCTVPAHLKLPLCVVDSLYKKVQ